MQPNIACLSKPDTRINTGIFEFIPMATSKGLLIFEIINTPDII